MKFKNTDSALFIDYEVIILIICYLIITKTLYLIAIHSYC